MTEDSMKTDEEHIAKQAKAFREEMVPSIRFALETGSVPPSIAQLIEPESRFNESCIRTTS